MHQFQQLADQLNRSVCADSGAEWRGHDERDVGLHVLGGRMSIVAADLYCASEFVLGWRGSWRNYVQHSDTDGAAAPELKERAADSRRSICVYLRLKFQFCFNHPNLIGDSNRQKRLPDHVRRVSLRTRRVQPATAISVRPRA